MVNFYRKIFSLSESLKLKISEVIRFNGLLFAAAGQGDLYILRAFVVVFKDDCSSNKPFGNPNVFYPGVEFELGMEDFCSV